MCVACIPCLQHVGMTWVDMVGIITTSLLPANLAATTSCYPSQPACLLPRLVCSVLCASFHLFNIHTFFILNHLPSSPSLACLTIYCAVFMPSPNILSGSELNRPYVAAHDFYMTEGRGTGFCFCFSWFGWTTAGGGVLLRCGRWNAVPRGDMRAALCRLEDTGSSCALTTAGIIPPWRAGCLPLLCQACIAYLQPPSLPHHLPPSICSNLHPIPTCPCLLSAVLARPSLTSPCPLAASYYWAFLL